MTKRACRGVAVCAWLCLFGCGGDDTSPTPAPGPSLLPADYPQGFVDVRACRRSSEHFPRIVIKSPASLAATYEGGPYPFATGSLIVKEEYADEACRDLIGYALMRKESAGYDPNYGDWRWQRLGPDRRVLADGKGEGAQLRCASCHAGQGCKSRDRVCAEP